MKYQAATLLLLPYSCTQAFTTTKTITTSPFNQLKSPATSIHSKPLPTAFVNQKSSFLFASDSDSDKQDDEIERLKSLAAKLRAEAAQLEAEKAQELADAAEKAFLKFDTNQDGSVSVAELKAGLEKVLKTDLSEKRVKELLSEFDKSGDGSLQLNEFVTIDQFRNTLEALSREEKRLAGEAKKKAQEEEQKAQLAMAQLELLNLVNDKPPSTSDKFLSLLPYLFPLMDGLQYGRFLLVDEGNPFVIILAILYGLYQTVPFSGFIAFFALSFLSGNPTLNRLIRFNMQQAIFIDIALFFPGLITGLIALISKQAGVSLPASMTEISSDLLFVTLLLTLGYCTVSSLLGVIPDKLPIISEAVNDRMPTADMFTIDSDGRLRMDKKDESKKDDKKNDKEDK